jgi:endonuclease/exonuclease/phosphatase family metal-dependent hydrolase
MTMGTAALSLACINVERSKHVSAVSAFLRAQAPEVVCLQELVPDDVDTLCRQLGYAHHFYVPMCLFPEQAGPRASGIGILSRHPFVSTADICYGGGGSGMDVLDRSSEEARFATNRYSVALADIAIGAETFTIGTTHFPWTDAARTADFQRSACDNLLRALEDRSLILCGDFNAPRGMEIFTRLAAQWTDNIPPTYATSVDPVLHRAGPLQLMVDGVFSTDDYSVSDVTLHQDVSDHCAITARVRRGQTL